MLTRFKIYNLLWENTLEYTRDYQQLHNILQKTETQEFHGIPGFHSIKPISKGGFGKVYQATHSVDGQTYAIKTIPMKFSRDSMVTDTIINRLKEVRCLARLSHPNIIRYFNSWLDIGISRKSVLSETMTSKSCNSLVEYGGTKHILDWEPDTSGSSGISRSNSLDSLDPMCSIFKIWFPSYSYHVVYPNREDGAKLTRVDITQPEYP